MMAVGGGFLRAEGKQWKFEPNWSAAPDTNKPGSNGRSQGGGRRMRGGGAESPFPDGQGRFHPATYNLGAGYRYRSAKSSLRRMASTDFWAMQPIMPAGRVPMRQFPLVSDSKRSPPSNRTSAMHWARCISGNNQWVIPTCAPGSTALPATRIFR